ncbi:hypothetical protein [Negativicoccus succinicivorans]
MVNALPETLHTETRETARKRRKDLPHRLCRLAQACAERVIADHPRDRHRKEF